MGSTSINIFEMYPERVWESPQYYYGYNPLGHLAVATRNRDSKFIDRHNFDVFEGRLAKYVGQGDPSEESPVYTWSIRHCFVGWVEFLMIHPNKNAELQKIVVDTLSEIAQHHILEDMDYYRKLMDLSQDWWDGLSEFYKEELLEKVSDYEGSVEEKIQYLRDEYEQEL